MTQNIITYIILLLASTYAIYKFWCAFTQAKKSNKCSGCAACPAKKEIQLLIEKNKNR